MQAKIPPVIVMLLFAFAMWLLQLFTPGAGVALPYRLAAAGLAFALGAFFCMAGVVSFRRASTTVNPLTPDRASTLVTSGIYRHSRNPMYVGFALFLVAFAALLGSWWSLLGVVAFVVFMDRCQIEAEERALRTLFAAQFEQYSREVRRWL